MKNIQEEIRQTLTENKVVLYMKGSPTFPQCGFSGKVSHMLRQLGVEYKSVNVLEDPDIRQGIKDYSNWPTIPQLYINGELVGGCDIVSDMFASGELKELLSKA